VGGLRLEFAGTALVAGDADGLALTTTEALSLWGGLNPETGEIVDRRHPLSGRFVSGRVLVLPHGRGSCSASGVLLESIRNGTAPAAVIVSQVDPIIGLGAILGEELYDRTVPVVLLAGEQRAAIADGDRITVRGDGRVTVERAAGADASQT
jgi:cis-L-3-hydroxyproline dehydratase